MSFNKELALKLAELSQRCYSDYTYKKDDDGFLLVVENDIQYLAFPGSYELGDWFHDVEFVKVWRDGIGNTHNGFADCYDNLKNQVYKFLDKSKKVIITGHSMGAAIASIFALALTLNGYLVEIVYTFASPRVGDSVWKTNFNNAKIEYYRVINSNDLVTKIPKLFYYHVGQEVQIGKKSFFSFIWNNALDHKIDNYIANLKKL